MPNLLQLQEQKSSILSQAAGLLSKGLRSKDSKHKYESLLAASDLIDNQIAQLRHINAELAKHPAPVAKEDSAETRRQKVNKAFRSYLRHGWQPDRYPELRDVTVASDGSTLVPETFAESYVEALRYSAPLLQYVFSKVVTSGQPVKLPITDSTQMNFQLLTETSTAPEVDPVVSSTSPADSMMDSGVLMTRYSWQELNDSFDLNEFLQKNVIPTVARFYEKYIVTGQDAAGNVAGASPTGGWLASLPATITLGSASTATPANLLALKSSLDMAYQLNGAFFASPSAVAYIEGLNDSTGRPIFNHRDENGFLEVYGSSLVPVASFPAWGTQSASGTTPVIAFADLSRAWGFVHSGLRMKTLVQRFAATLESALLSYVRVSNLAGTSSAAAAIVTPAS